MTESERNELFATTVLGWTCKTFPDGVCPHIKHWYDENGKFKLRRDLNFGTSLDAVWPTKECMLRHGIGEVEVTGFDEDGGIAAVFDPVHNLVTTKTGSTPVAALRDALIEAVKK